MKKIKVYQNLYIQIKNERIKNDELIFQFNKLLKDITLIKSQINKNEYIKKGIEKWIVFQFEKEKRKI